MHILLFYSLYYYFSHIYICFSSYLHVHSNILIKLRPVVIAKDTITYSYATYNIIDNFVVHIIEFKCSWSLINVRFQSVSCVLCLKLCPILCIVIFDIILIRNFKMPKVKTPIRSCLQSYVNYHKDSFKTDGSILYCNICEIPVYVTTKFLVDQHLLQF